MYLLLPATRGFSEYRFPQTCLYPLRVLDSSCCLFCFPVASLSVSPASQPGTSLGPAPDSPLPWHPLLRGPQSYSGGPPSGPVKNPHGPGLRAWLLLLQTHDRGNTTKPELALSLPVTPAAFPPARAVRSLEGPRAGGLRSCAGDPRAGRPCAPAQALGVQALTGVGGSQQAGREGTGPERAGAGTGPLCLGF